VQLAAVVVALLAASGCATSRVVTRVDPELTVFTFRRAYTNVHALVGPGGVLLVDTGEADEVDALLRDLKRAGIEPADVRAIVLTHGHGDHAGGAARLAAVTGAPVVAGRGDAARLQSGRTEGLCATDRTAQRRKAGYERATFPVVTPDRLITVETDLREVADIGIDGRVRPMPGHTEGSVVIETTKAVFVGDLLRGSIVGSRARRHFYMCDLESNDRDVAALASSLPDSVKVVFPGHFGPLPRESIAEGFAESHARVQAP
jgi:hydroxyacylglutathione hydrolase